MTRKQAYEFAIKVLNNSQINEIEKQEAIKCLEGSIKDYPLNRWTRETILDACRQFLLDNKRPIRLTDFDRSPYLPSHVAIKRKFGMSAGEFRDKYFPLPERSIAAKYGREELVKIFREEYLRCGARTRKEYDTLRSKTCPCSAALLKYTGLEFWYDLLRLAEVENGRERSRPPKMYEVTYHADFLDRLNSIDEFEKLPEEEQTRDKLKHMLDNCAKKVYKVDMTFYD